MFALSFPHSIRVRPSQRYVVDGVHGGLGRGPWLHYGSVVNGPHRDCGLGSVRISHGG